MPHVQLKQVNVSELSDKELDYAVYKAEVTKLDARRREIVTMFFVYNKYNPSTNPNHAHDIIVRENITIGPQTVGDATLLLNSYYAIIGFMPDSGEHLYQQRGKTFLEAAMRVYVESVFGETVSLPDDISA